MQRAVTYIFLFSLFIHSILAAETRDSIKIVNPIWSDFVNIDGSGVYLDLVNKVFVSNDAQLTFEEMPFLRSVKSISLGVADLLFGIYENCTKVKLDKTDDLIVARFPIALEKTAVIYKKYKQDEWLGISSLQGKTVAAIRGYDYDQSIAVEMKYQEFSNHQQLWGLLQRGRIDFYMEDYAGFEHFVQQNSIDMSEYDVQIVLRKFTYIGFTNSDRGRQLVKIYEREFPELHSSGWLQSLYQEYQLKYSLKDITLNELALGCTHFN